MKFYDNLRCIIFLSDVILCAKLQLLQYYTKLQYHKIENRTMKETLQSIEHCQNCDSVRIMDLNLATLLAGNCG